MINFADNTMHNFSFKEIIANEIMFILVTHKLSYTILSKEQ